MKQTHPHKHVGNEDRADRILKKAGLKVTRTRAAILEVLLKEHGPFSVNEICIKLNSPDSQGCFDNVTVYRTLSTMEKAKLITKCDFGDQIGRYEICHSEHHHHIICTECNRVDPVLQCPIKDNWEEKISQGYHNIAHRLEFFGICPSCQA